MQKQKIELTWIGKDSEPQLEPRILLEDESKSFGDKNSGNMLIHGDNLLALKAEGFGYEISHVQGSDGFLVMKDGKWVNVYRSLKGAKAYIAKKVGKDYFSIVYATYTEAA